MADDAPTEPEQHPVEKAIQERRARRGVHIPPPPPRLRIPPTEPKD